MPLLEFEARKKEKKGYVIDGRVGSNEKWGKSAGRCPTCSLVTEVLLVFLRHMPRLIS